MIYINNNKLNKGYINEHNKAYIGDKLLYWNVSKNIEGDEILYDIDFEFTGTTQVFRINNTTRTATTSPYQINVSDLNITPNSNLYYAMFSGTSTNNTITKVNRVPNSNGIATSCYNMFRYCTKMTSVDLSNINTSNVTTFGSMFYYCSGLTELDLSPLDMSKLSTASYMLYNCTKLTSLIIPHIDTINSSYMFYNLSSLKEIYWLSTKAPMLGTSTSYFTNMNKTGTLYVPKGSDYSSLIGTSSSGGNKLPSGWSIKYLDITTKLNKNEYINEYGILYESYESYVTINGKTYNVGNTKGDELPYRMVDTYETICDGTSLSKKMEKYVTLPNGKEVATGVYVGGEVIEENSNSCRFITLSFDTEKNIPMQTFRIDATDPNTSGYYFIRFSDTPNGSYSNTKYSICPDEGKLWDNGTSKVITSVGKHIEGNIYEYTFSKVIYFADAEENAPLSQVQYKPM